LDGAPEVACRFTRLYARLSRWIGQQLENEQWWNI
jgi:hypothetical protein